MVESLKIYILDWSGHNAKMDDTLNFCARAVVSAVADELRVPVSFVRSAAHADLVVVGGGSMIFSRDRHFFRTLRSCRVPYFFLGTGARDESDEALRLMYGEILKKSAGIGVRGPETVEALEKLGIDRSDMRVVGDIGFQFRGNAYVKPLDRYSVGVSARFMRTGEKQYVSNEQICEIFSEIACFLQKRRPDSHFYLFDTCRNLHDSDRHALKKFVKRARLKREAYTWVDMKDPVALCSYIGSMDWMLSQRLHGNLLAWVQGVPGVNFDYKDRKTYDALSVVGVEEYIMRTDQYRLDAYAALYSKLLENKTALIESVLSKCDENKNRQREFVRAMLKRFV